MKTRTLIWIAVALIVVLFAKNYVQWKSDVRTWRVKRAAWHEQCDAYVGIAGRARGRANQAAVKDCQRELDELLAEAKSKGWGN